MMRICWDNLNDVRLTKDGCFVKNGNAKYVYMEECKVCGDPYLMDKYCATPFCGKSCSHKGKRCYNYKHGKANTREYYKIYIKKIDNKIKMYLRTRIYHALKGINKSKHTEELIGCSIEFLKQHLESQFTKGMSWDNYSLYGWHVDHIRPCTSFNLSKSKEQLKCFNYKNLQPLWAIDNHKKYNKVNKGK